MHQPVEKAATLSFRARFLEKIICTAKIRVRKAGASVIKKYDEDCIIKEAMALGLSMQTCIGSTHDDKQQPTNNPSQSNGVMSLIM